MQDFKSSTIDDIKDLPAIKKTIQSNRPEIIFHLAAQPLVRDSYDSPVDTFATNLMGTVNLLEAARSSSVKAIVIVTTDKCYENQKWVWPYRESDRLGGSDPYSASKSCAEIATAAYRESFFSNSGIAVATVRAGNVLGGGDWSKDRLVPDFFRTKFGNQKLQVRYPGSIRPWQHVLDPLSGYLNLAERLVLDGAKYSEAWNFGPMETNYQTVTSLIEKISKITPHTNWEIKNETAKPEHTILKLDSSKSISKLDWKPRWELDKTLLETANWYLAWNAKQDMKKFSLAQIESYLKNG
jgi:CDP-glucose 4,6-dehydratase